MIDCHDMKEPIALGAYESIADAYAAQVETKPHNAYYERPAMLSLLPDVAGCRVLDAGCGPGVYAEWLLNHGAQVVGVDFSQRMVELARERLGDRAEIIRADLAASLDFLDDASFDIVLAALVIDDIHDWRSMFRQLHRVLLPSGYFVFSLEHPFSDFTMRHMTNYFRTEMFTYTSHSFGFPVVFPSYRRPLSEIVNSVVDSGFTIDRLLEPLPTVEFKKTDPEEYAKLCARPGFLCIRARREGNGV